MPLRSSVSFQVFIKKFRMAPERFIRSVEQTEAKGLRRFGYRVMTRARKNIKDRSRESAPGEGPTNWKAGKGPLRSLTLYEATGDRVQVFTALFARRRTIDADVPGDLEHGSSAKDIAPRPYLTPAFHEVSRKVLDNFHKVN